jgi:hypothetical protein
MTRLLRKRTFNSRSLRELSGCRSHFADCMVRFTIAPKLALAALLTGIATNGATAFLIIMAMAFGLILPRMLFERVVPAPA